MDLVSQTEDTIVIKYTSHTVVAEGSGTVRREFAGEATMRKDGPVWLIDKIQEHQVRVADEQTEDEHNLELTYTNGRIELITFKLFDNIK